MDKNCIFCKIVAGEIPSKRYFENDDMIVIKDLEPKAKLHYLCIPKDHFARFTDMNAEQAETVKRCFCKIAEIKDELGFENGYRVLINQGDDAGQTVQHLHIHLLGGEKLSDF